MAERDCSNCRFHIQADPVTLFCMNCLMDPELPGWEPKVELAESYYAALDERYPVELGAEVGERAHYEEGFLDGIQHHQQSRKESLIESFLNVFSGWLISLTLWMWVIAPAFNIQSSLAESALLNGIFTVISIVRGYFWRRLFVNKFWRKAN